MKAKKKKCKECNGEFLAVKSWQLFCSDDCRREYHTKATCPKCKYQFKITKE